ncbi:MAG: DUF503 domain-containing protein [Anaerolineales bacterium]|nr:DUF503 domain-containing protein [Anaerolineales bacterium]
MHVAVCEIKLNLEGVASLKEKRRIMKSLLRRLPQNFNVAAAEIDFQDVWQTGMLGLVTIGNDSGYLHGILEKAITWIEEMRPDCPIDAYRIEFR